MQLHRARMLWIVGGAIVLGAVAWRLRPEALEVEVAPASLGSLRVTLEEEGVTRFRHHMELAAPVTGRMEESRLTVGDSVHRGDVLVRVHPAPLDPRSRTEAQALLAQSASRSAEARAQLQQLQVALDEARRDKGRADRLAVVGAIPERELEQAVALVRMREQEVEAAMARVAAAREGERAARATLLGADPGSAGGLPATIRSPIDGVVLRLFESHDRVIPAGTPLVEVGDPTSLEVVSDVLSRDASRITPGMAMEVRTADRAPMAARVARVEPAAFTKRSALGVDEQRVNVVGAFDGAVTGLGDAFEVDVSIILWEGTRILRIPSAALVPLDSGWAVFAVREGRARQLPITIGARGSHEVEVTGGITEGTLVILRPDERLHDGGRVRTTP